MFNPFVPLIPTAAPTSAAPGNHVPLSPAEGRVSGFAAIAPAPAGPVSMPETAPSPPAVHAVPTVSFKRDGDRVTQIEIRCSCGEVIQLDCDYDGCSQG